MKFTILVAVVASLLATVSVTSAQSDAAAECTLCLQQALQSLPACQGVEANVSNPAYAACLCASLGGAWIDSCSGADVCGSTISTFRANYATNIQAAGLNCANGQASYVPLA